MKKILLVLSMLPLFAGAQIISTIAGNGYAGYSGDGASANSAELYNPEYCAIDDLGNLYISDVSNHVIRKVNTSGVISTYAGYYTVAWIAAGYGGDGGPATAARLNMPHGLAVDHLGNLFIADQQNFRIRKVDPSGIITTYAGIGSSGLTGDGGPATAAKLQNIWGIALDDVGNLYITEISGQRIRKVSTSGIITTIAGNGAAGYTGDGGPATAATLMTPIDVATDHSGNIYIADELNNCIRKVNSAGIISTFAGNGMVGFTGDGGPATNAQMHWPVGVTIDKSTGPNAGYLYFSDEANQKIRQVSTAGIINTIAGTGAAGYNGDGIVATLAQLYSPYGVATDPSSGRVYIADAGNNRIRSINDGCIISASPGNTICTGMSVTYTIATTPGCISPTYQWLVNGIPVGAGSTYTYTPSSGDLVRCVRTCSGGAPENSNIISMTVSSSLSPSITISSSASGVICAGTFVTFTSTATNPGSLPVYQWKVNGVTVGSGTTYTYAPSNGDSVRCILTSSLLCAAPATASSSTIFMTVASSSTLPTVTINAMPGSTVCSGTAVTYTATTTTGGATPYYQWKVNGINVGSGGYTYTYTPANGDLVSCQLTSSAPCITTTTALSNTMSMTTTPVLTPTISITGPVGKIPGSTVTLNATVANAGSSYSIEWMNYGVTFSTTSVPTTTYTKTTGTDVITAKVASTSAGCYDTTTSAIILVQALSTAIDNHITSALFRVYPNPASTEVTIEAHEKITNITITNLLGQTVYKNEYSDDKVSINISELPASLYFIKVNGTTIRKFVKQ